MVFVFASLFFSLSFSSFLITLRKIFTCLVFFSTKTRTSFFLSVHSVGTTARSWNSSGTRPSLCARATSFIGWVLSGPYTQLRSISDCSEMNVRVAVPGPPFGSFYFHHDNCMSCSKKTNFCQRIFSTSLFRFFFAPLFLVLVFFSAGLWNQVEGYFLLLLLTFNGKLNSKKCLIWAKFSGAFELCSVLL